MSADHYDHDEITSAHLSDLLNLDSALTRVTDDGIKAQHGDAEKDEFDPPLHKSSSTPTDGPNSTVSPVDLDNSDHNVTNNALVEDLDDQLEAPTEEWDLNFPLDPVLLDVPQADPEISYDAIDSAREEPEDESDYKPEVTQETRARQLATAFLVSIDECSARHVDWITDIILARRWTSAQKQVTELWKARHSLKAIYLAFQLSQHWRDCDCFDERQGDRFYRRPNLSWLDASRLVSFYGEDSSVEELAIFIELERHLWRQSAQLVSRYRFKEYLLRYRIADECRHPDLGWYRPLDPSDGRFFDGSANPEYTAEWWEDEQPLAHSPRYTSRRIYMGDLIGSLIPQVDDGLQWLESRDHGF